MNTSGNNQWTMPILPLLLSPPYSYAYLPLLGSWPYIELECKRCSWLTMEEPVGIRDLVFDKLSAFKAFLSMQSSYQVHLEFVHLLHLD
jgi:hypothetical protein